MTINDVKNGETVDQKAAMIILAPIRNKAKITQRPLPKKNVVNVTVQMFYDLHGYEIPESEKTIKHFMFKGTEILRLSEVRV